jgi:hypothetical protein
VEPLNGNLQRFDVPTADDPTRWLCRRCAPETIIA